MGMTRVVCVGLALSMFSMVGCGGGIERGDVTGRITIHGQSPGFSGLRLSFLGPDGVPVMATVGEDGSYRVIGVAAGEVRVAVIWTDPDHKVLNTPDRSKRAVDLAKHANDPEDKVKLGQAKNKLQEVREMKKAQKEAAKAQAKSPIPAALADHKTSGLRLTVVPGKPNTFDHDVKK
jgi:hypothetical protein